MIMKYYIQFIKKYLFRHKVKLAVVVLLTILQSIVVAGIPIITSAILDYGITKGDIDVLETKILVFAFLLVINSVITIINNFVMAQISEKIGYMLRYELNNKLCKLEYSFFLRNAASNIVNSFNREIETIKKHNYMLLRVLSNIISILASLFLIFLLDWKIGLFTFCTSILYIISIKCWGKKISEYAEKSYVYHERILNTLLNTYRNVLVIKLNDAIDYVNNRFDSEYSYLYKNEVKLETVYSANINVGALIMSLTTVVLWYGGGIGCIQGTFTLGKLVAIVGYQNMLLNPINFICDFSNSYQNTIKAIENLKTILDCQEEVEGSIHFHNKINTIKFERICFKFDSTVILDRADLLLEQGKIYALVGESGIGKSTIAKLVVKLLEPVSGRILVNNIPIKELNLQDIRNKIGYVMQDSIFFNDTILNNIFWNQDEDIAKLISYSMKLNIYDEVMSFSQKWDTFLCEDSQNISGGQKKRLDILRNIVKNASVLIFDEAFNGIDAKRKSDILSFLRCIRNDYIILIITHNQDELKYCDKIYEIKNKKIMESAINESC